MKDLGSERPGMAEAPLHSVRLSPSPFEVPMGVTTGHSQTATTTTSDVAHRNLEFNEVFSREKDIVSMYVDSAKTYAQLSAGGLAVAAAFANKLFNRTDWLRPNPWLLRASVLFLLALFFSAAYQYTAVARLERLSGLLIKRRVGLPSIITNHAYWLYGLMIAFFLLGALCLVVLAWNGLHAGPPQILAPPASADSVSIF